jgi:hypothetical protein
MSDVLFISFSACVFAECGLFSGDGGGEREAFFLGWTDAIA